MTRREIERAANAAREAGIPDFLNRWIGMTPKALAANERARAEIARRQSNPFAEGEK